MFRLSFSRPITFPLTRSFPVLLSKARYCGTTAARRDGGGGGTTSTSPSSIVSPPLFDAWKAKLLSTPPIISYDVATLERARLLASTLPTRQQLDPFSIEEGSAKVEPGDSLIIFPPVVPESQLSPDGSTSYPLPSPPPALFNTRMWVGGSFHFSHAPLKVGSKVQEALSVESVLLKKAGELCFVETKRTISEVEGGAVAVEERRRHVYRNRVAQKNLSDMISLPPPPPIEIPTKPDFSSAALLITPVTLFRFSALTFNAHLIHYSLPYCRDVESLPAPLIHAPLTALLLLDLVRANLPSSDWRIASFEYRATSPLVAGQSITLVGSWDLDERHGSEMRSCEVWAVGDEGKRVGMTGIAVLVRGS